MLLRTRGLLTGTIWVGAAFRFHGFFYNSFGSDEALFAYWARLIAAWQDPLLTGQLVDKPPLLFYLQALFYPILGAVEWAARMPDFIASILLIPLTGLIAWRLFRDELMVILAAGLVALSPLAIQYSGSAYIDPLLTFFLMASLLAVISDRKVKAAQSVPRKHGLTAGILFGLAVATKYQAWLFLPLITSFALFNHWNKRTWIRWIAGLLAACLVVVAWELGRSGNFTLVNRQLASYGGLRFAWSWELWPRLEAWIGIWADIFASPILYFVLLLGLILSLVRLIFQMNHRTSYVHILLGFVFGYFVLHWFLAVPTWDRYIIPLIPILAILISAMVYRGISFYLDNSRTFPGRHLLAAKYVRLAPLLLLVIQAQIAFSAYIDTQQGSDETLTGRDAHEVAEYFQDAPYGTVLYDHWYSWQWRYHLFDTKVYISWFPTPAALIEDLKVFASRNNPNYIVLPPGDEAIPIIRKLAAAGFSLEKRSPFGNKEHDTTMILYEIKSLSVETS